MVRRPRHGQAIAGVCREAAILPQLRNHLTLPVRRMQVVIIRRQNNYGIQSKQQCC
ncbi:hypothetical protein [[Phormidium ambiguum] IAM M-71]|uniref:hypothetical protein n=1 Tax=[Phormidium ambiguum] IAM M-71 TaxID=454136 RepID=UPI0015BE8352|nr:hypothetical protein [Phormidium ambiguum]